MIFTVMLIPLIQSNLHLFLVKDLKGFFTYAEDVELKRHNWFNSDFQEKKEKYINENFGFRNTLVRILNQLNYSFFKKSSNKEIIFGKEGYICTKIYLESYRGEYFVGSETVIKNSFLVKQLQDRLEKQGKVFLPVIAPNKVNFYSEYFTEGIVKKCLTNYGAYKYCFDKLKIKYIDFESYFLSIKKTTKYPLFSKYGIHWSTYGHYLATDSIINYLNSQYQLGTNRIIRDTNIELSDSLRDFDNDIGESMNLFVDQLKSEKLAYPKTYYTKCTANKPPLLVIGDSFNFGIQLTDMQNQVFSDYKLLYYFRELIPYSADKDAFKKLNIKNEINNHQVILLLFTEQNFANYGCGFIEKATNILNGIDAGSFDDNENKIVEMIKNINNNFEWMNKLKTEAVNNNKNLDSLIRENAIYVIKSKIKEERKSRDLKIQGMIDYIKKNPVWIKDIEKRAKEKGVSIDTVMLNDAIYQVDINNK